MKTLGLLALPLLAIIAAAGLASAYPFWEMVTPGNRMNPPGNISQLSHGNMTCGGKFHGDRLPPWDIQNMTHEEKDMRVQVLELQQEMLQNQIAYLKGELTEEEFQEMLQQHFDEMQSLREQLREQIQLGNPDDMGHGCGGRGFKSFGPRMGGMGF
jgi:hypothetical protein